MLDFPLLRGLSVTERRMLVGACTRRSFARREIVFHEGDPADCLHFVASGRFAVRITTKRGDTATLRVITIGDVFGELALIDRDMRRIATVVALEPGCTFALQAAQFAALRARHPQVDRVLTAMLTANVRRTSAMVVEALYLPVRERVARRLGELADIYGNEIPLTQDYLGEMAGTTRATANGVLRRLESQGVVALERGRIIVLDRSALEA